MVDTLMDGGWTWWGGYDSSRVHQILNVVRTFGWSLLTDRRTSSPSGSYDNWTLRTDRSQCILVVHAVLTRELLRSTMFSAIARTSTRVEIQSIDQLAASICLSSSLLPPQKGEYLTPVPSIRVDTAWRHVGVWWTDRRMDRSTDRQTRREWMKEGSIYGHRINRVYERVSLVLSRPACCLLHGTTTPCYSGQTPVYRTTLEQRRFQLKQDRKESAKAVFHHRMDALGGLVL